SECALAAGFELLPNPAILLRPFKAEERVVVIRSAPCHADSEAYYLAGVLLLALGTAIAEVDGEVDHVEVLHVSEIVNSLYHFNDHDKQRLGVLRRRLIKFPPKLTSLTRRVRAVLTAEELAEVGKFLVGVAGANFRVLEDERRALRRAYRAFALPVAELDALLADLSDEASPDEDGNPGINRDVLAQYMRDTKAFALRLGVAMQQVVAVEGEDTGKQGIWYGRRDSTARATAPETERKADPYCDALYALVQRPDWTEAEFVALGEKHGVYVDGAVTAMDDWTGEVSGEDSVRYVLAVSDEG
ncbi:MAG: TerB family tellurite resistance protein, partial [Candidatus Hydrogenedentes bacterium]|nr:TerB family tellurite resistance protein [Candidatus Hydrogenedentota bacterium]